MQLLLAAAVQAHDHMDSLMQGMFWGGLVMALPPVAVGVGIAVWAFRRQRADAAAAAEPTASTARPE